jgi:hypothetical protein
MKASEPRRAADELTPLPGPASGWFGYLQPRRLGPALRLVARANFGNKRASRHFHVPYPRQHTAHLTTWAH